MKTNDPKGRAFIIFIAVYLLVKGILNSIIGGLNLSDILFAVVACIAMYTGLQFLNYGVSAFLALGIITHLVYNLTHLPGSAIYLIEAALDVAVILLLVLQPNIKAHFTNKWNELDQLIKKG